MAKRDPHVVGNHGEVITWVINVATTDKRAKGWSLTTTRNGAWRSAWAYAVTQICIGRSIATITVEQEA